MRKLISSDDLKKIHDDLYKSKGAKPTSAEIKSEVKRITGKDMDESTIRGRLIAMGHSLSSIANTIHQAVAMSAGQAAASVTPQDVKPNELNLKGKAAKENLPGGTKVQIIDDIKTMPDKTPPGLTDAIRKMAGQIHEVEYVNNQGFVILKGVMDGGDAVMFSPSWLSTDIKTPKYSRPMPTRAFKVDPALASYIPSGDEFSFYIERDIDETLATHYLLGKHPISQGKQGTGKTMSHAYFAFKQKLPFFLFSCYEDFKLGKLFGDKTIINGSVVFQESLFTQAIQSASVIVFDEINAISQANTYDFHAMLQNRQLFIKDADNGKGKTYRLHDDCLIGFAQNPKSAKYIGGNVRSSNFLGRCTYLTYPEFKDTHLKKAIRSRYKDMPQDMIDKFVKFYFGCVKSITEAEMPIDISIRQLNNAIDLYAHGMPLRQAIETGIAGIGSAASQTKATDAMMLIAETCWAELMKK